MAEMRGAGIPVQNIQAAVLRRRGGPLRIESLEIEGPRNDELLVAIAGAGICRTDIDIIDEWDAAETPAVLGHEGAGVVIQAGKDVKDFNPGDHVVLSYQSCGQCPPCREGRPWDCRYLYEANFGLKRLDGTNALGRSGVRGHFFGQSSWATHSLATRRNTVKVPPELPLELLAPLGCGLQTGAGTIMNTLAVPAGAGVAVFGTGSVGLAAVMAARVNGAGPIIGVDTHPGRLEMAVELGATHAIDSRRDDILDRIEAIAGGVGYAVDTTGDPRVLDAAVDALHPGGTLALLAGAGGPGHLSEGKRAISVIQGSSVPQLFIPGLIELYRAGQFPFDRIIRYYEFHNINQAIADVKRGVTIKAVLRVGGPGFNRPR